MSETPQAGIVELVIPGEGIAAGSIWPWLFAGAGAAFVVLAVLVFWKRRLNRRDPVVTAYAKLAKAHGLSRIERRELERLAESIGTPPAALLLAPRAMGARAGYSAVLRGLALRLTGSVDARG